MMMSTAFTAIDLSKLAAPSIVETLSFETILQEMRNDLAARDPDLFSELAVSDPAMVLLETFAYREVLLRNRMNEAVKQTMLAYATSTNLDQLAALFGVTRLLIDAGDEEAVPPIPPTYESDEALRARTQLALEGFTSAGPVGAYRFHALSASGQVKDVGISNPTPGTVLVTVLSSAGNGTPDAGLLSTVAAALGADDVRPLCDTVNVQAATIVNYTVEAELTLATGPDPAVVLATAQAAVEAYTTAQHAVGATVAISGIYAALHQAGVVTVDLTSPAADVETTATEAPYCTNIDVTEASA